MSFRSVVIGSFVGLGLLFGTGNINAQPSAAAPASSTATPVKMPIGMNLAGINDYSQGFPFRNLMWGARPWMTHNDDGSGPHNTELIEKVPLDPQGYPLELPLKLEGNANPQMVFTIIPNVVEAGKYVVLYEGDGEIIPAMGTKLVSSAPGRVVIQNAGTRHPLSGITGNRYEGIAIKRSTRGNHVRNIRIVSEADETTDLKAKPFREDFLTYCKQWHAIRFMDWQLTNGSLEKEWSGRKLPDFYTMIGSGGDAIGRYGKPPASEFQQLFSGGTALELIIQVANTTRVNPWVCVPHRATPEYIREMAKLFKEKLDPSLTIYVEYSNEVWNWQFQQAHWMLNNKAAGDRVVASGKRAWRNDIAPTEFPLDNGTVAREGGDGHPERMGALDRICFEQWEAVYTGEDRKRLVRVIGVQHAWEDTAKRTAKWVMENGGADAISPAGYFGPNKDIYQRWEAAGANLTVEQVVADMQEDFQTNSTKWTRQIAAIAKQHNLRYLVYEGGQHIQPKDQKESPYMPALKAAQYHPGLYQVYMNNFRLHQEIGCELFMAFSSVGLQGSRYGSWGHQEYYGQPRGQLPKFDALIDVQTPR